MKLSSIEMQPLQLDDPHIQHFMTSSSSCIVLVSPLLLLLKQLSQRILPSLFHPADGQFEEKEGMDVCVHHVPMGREFGKFKTGFTESQKADSARADSPGILTFFS